MTDAGKEQERQDKAKQLMDEAQELLEAYKKSEEKIKKELTELQLYPIQRQEEEETDNLSDALSSIKLSHITKIRKFSNGENFSRFCERFKEYIYITKIRDQNLYVFFLQSVDDKTYSILKTVTLKPSDKCDAEAFCEIYKREIYGDESLSLKNDVLNCQQNSDETISEYAYRLREKANIAYLNTEMGEENCLLAFLRGVKNIDIKTKINEASLDSFNETVRLAKKIEGVKSMLSGEKPEAVPILKQTTFKDNPSNLERRNQWPSSNGYESGSEYLSRSNVRSNSIERCPSRDSNRATNGGHRSRQNFVGETRNFRNSRRPIICWGCNKIGHKLAVCWRSNANNRYRDYSNGNVHSNNNPNLGYVQSRTNQDRRNGQNYNPYNHLN